MRSSVFAPAPLLVVIEPVPAYFWACFASGSAEPRAAMGHTKGKGGGNIKSWQGRQQTIVVRDVQRPQERNEELLRDMVRGGGTEIPQANQTRNEQASRRLSGRCCCQERDKANRIRARRTGAAGGDSGDWRCQTYARVRPLPGPHRHGLRRRPPRSARCIPSRQQRPTMATNEHTIKTKKNSLAERGR